MRYIYDPAWRQEQARLDAIAALYDPGTIALLSELGVDRGWRCWEAGAGSGTIGRWLGERVGSAGEVLVSDLDTRFLESLRDERIVVSSHDVCDDPPALDRFDLVHARALLAHVGEPVAAIGEMIRALRPGGWLVVEDVVFPPRASDPQLAVLERVGAAVLRLLQAAHADPEYGIKLPGALEHAGLVDVGYAARVPVVRTGTPDVEMLALTLEHLHSRLQADGELSADDVDEAVRALRTPGGTVLSTIMIAAWGRRPPTS